MRSPASEKLHLPVRLGTWEWRGGAGWWDANRSGTWCQGAVGGVPASEPCRACPGCFLRGQTKPIPHLSISVQGGRQSRAPLPRKTEVPTLETTSCGAAGREGGEAGVSTDGS